MKKIILLSVIFVGTKCLSQSIAFPVNYERNSLDYKNNTINGYDFEILSDSISKIKIESDTVTKYKITKIVDDEKFYIIYASGRAKDGNEYQYRIKSDKLNYTKTCDCIEEGGIYQLDIRGYSNTNQRLHFLPGVALNLITTQGFSPFDIVMFLDEKETSNYYNKALNLKGLCIIEEE